MCLVARVEWVEKPQRIQRPALANSLAYVLIDFAERLIRRVDPRSTEAAWNIRLLPRGESLFSGSRSQELLRKSYPAPISASHVEYFQFADRTYTYEEIANERPVVMASDVRMLAHASMAAASLFTAGDADGDTLFYDLLDVTQLRPVATSS